MSAGLLSIASAARSADPIRPFPAENPPQAQAGWSPQAARRLGIAAGVSLALHVQVMLALAVVYTQAHHGALRGGLVSLASTDAAAAPFETIVPLEAVESPDPGGGALASPLVGLVGELGGPAEAGLSAGVADGIGAGGGPGGGSGTGEGGEGNGKVGFFGTEAAGERFVFVVDCSGSMTGDRFARACRELSRSLQSLNENQEFFIIFFSDRAIPMYSPHPATEPVKANRLSRMKARKWIINRGPFGNTFPDEALTMALRMRPDVVFFLTDGEFAPTALEVCRRENTKKATIHTIAFGTRFGEQLLQAIADEHKGRYRFVP